MGLDLTIDQSAEQLTNQLAQVVNSRGLSVPAIFFLELSKPLATVIHAAGLIGAPFVAALFGRRNFQIFLEVAADRTRLEQLIRAIERLANKERNAGH